jgi:hypothetical protein
MENRRLAMAMAALLLGGCARPVEPVSPELPASRTARNAPLATGKELPAHAFSNRKIDEFGFPLHIHLDVPDVPPEIRGPSTPNREKPVLH